MKRLDMNYEQVARLNKRQSMTLSVVGMIMIALALFGMIVNVSGTRQTLSTRQALLGGLSKQTALLDDDKVLTAMGQDLNAGLESIAEQVSAAKQQSLSNQRDQLPEGRKYDRLTSQMAEYDSELAMLGERLAANGGLESWQPMLMEASALRQDTKAAYDDAAAELKTHKSAQSKAKKALTNAQKKDSTATAEEVAQLQADYDAAAQVYTAAEAVKDETYAAYTEAKTALTALLGDLSAALPTVTVWESVLLFFSAALTWCILLVLGVELLIIGIVCIKAPKHLPLSMLADVLIYDFFIVLASVMVSPLLYVAVGSFSSTGLAQFRFSKLDFSAYKMIAFSQRTMRSILNSFLITIAGTGMNIVLTSVTAYALSKKDLPGRNWMMKLVIFFMLFHAGLVPDYILVSNTLGLTNTYWAIWLPVLISSSNLIIMKNFFQQLPASIEESARIDGCNEIQSFIHIVIPMSMASIATFSLFYAVGHWNNYQRAMIYISDPNKFPITVLLRQVVILSQGSLADDVLPEVQVWAPTNSVKYATIMVGTVPIICVYPFLQKHFTKGVLMGSVKG